MPDEVVASILAVEALVAAAIEVPCMRVVSSAVG